MLLRSPPTFLFVAIPFRGMNFLPSSLSTVGDMIEQAAITSHHINLVYI